MIFLPVTLTLTLISLTTLVLILSREELTASASDNEMVDGRFYFEDSNCPKNWKRQLKLEPELKLERPSLELRARNDTKILDRPSPTVIHMGAEYQTEYDFGTGVVKMVCKAPYPVILLAVYNDDQVGLEEEVFHLTTTNIYNKSSYTFEIQTWFRTPLNYTRNNVFYCQAVHNPCFKSREKLWYFYDKSAKAMSFTLRYYSLGSGSADSYHNHDYDSNSTLNPNSSSITPLEFMFGANLSLNLSFLNSSSEYQYAHEDENNENNSDTNDSECKAFFYYEEFRDYSKYREGRINLRYRCEFSDGTPGSFQRFRRCSTWGRCRFLVAARKQKAKNCWRRYTAGKTCLNCTAQNLGLFITEPFIPHCTTYRDNDGLDQEVLRISTEVDNHLGNEDETKVPEIDRGLENGTTDGATEGLEVATEASTADNVDDHVEKDDDEDVETAIRSVEGTPLYVGFPPPGFKIQRPFIRTDAYDQDDLEESTLVRMNPFLEIQLFNTTIQITCESNEWYTSTIFVFAFEFESVAKKGKVVQTNLHFFPVDKTGLKMRNFGNGYFDSQTVTINLNRSDLTRIFCFVGVQNSYKWINASRPIRVLEYQEFYTPSPCLNTDNLDLEPTGLNEQQQLPRVELSYVKTTGVNKTEVSETNPELLINAPISALSCFANYPIQVLSTFNITSEGRKFVRQKTEFDTYQNHSSYSFTLARFEVNPKRENHVYRCQSLENPCLHRSIVYSYVPGSTRRQKFVHVPQNDNGSSAIKRRKSNSDSGLELEFGSPSNYRECEVLFFYRELVDFPGYEFRCEFPMEDTGEVNFHYCDSLNDCANLYRNRRQSKVCWRKVQNWRKCRDCKESRSVGFRPFVATCQNSRNLYIYPNFDFEGPRVKESTFGNFVVFGLSSQTNRIAPIYFSNEDIEAHTTMFLEPFEKYQLFNTSLNVTCVSSAYYMSSEDVHIAKFYGGRTELQFTRKSERYSESQFKVHPEKHEWRITRNIELGNDPGLTHIVCIGITWLNFRKQVNCSREIYLQGSEEPKILLDAGSFEETLKNTPGTRNSQMSDVDEQEYEFLVSSENQTLVCHGRGFPPPKIQWLTTAKNAPKPEETEVYSSRSVSRIFLPLIDAGIIGIYVCTATNSQGTATAILKVNLKYPVNKLMVAIVTSSVLIVIGLLLIMALLWRRNRGLMEKLRDLTQEEVEEFHLGSRTKDPDDPLAQIYALPYDWSLEVPRELIELDETSVLGIGEFGLVRSGYIKIRQDCTGKDEKRLVAIKQAKPKLRAEEFKNILSEIKVMCHLKQHENVLQILAACTTSIKKCQVLVVMEFCELGDLHKYLRDRKYVFEDVFTATPDEDADPGSSGYAPVSSIRTDTLSTHHLIDFSLGIANGMNYLRQKRVVHGDLAARNVLLTKTLQVKVSDFGYSTHLINYASYTKNEQMVIPWRWFSIEALKEMKLSFKSDVWAFGVLLYEIFTLGELPYSGEEYNVKFIQDLAGGKRLEKPNYTNDEIYAVMTDCWQKEPSERPTFQKIYDRLLLIKNELS